MVIVFHDKIFMSVFLLGIYFQLDLIKQYVYYKEVLRNCSDFVLFWNKGI